MVTTDLLPTWPPPGRQGDNLIESAPPKVGGQDYSYGAPTQLIGGKPYLGCLLRPPSRRCRICPTAASDGQVPPSTPCSAILARAPAEALRLRAAEEHSTASSSPMTDCRSRPMEITPEHPCAPRGAQLRQGRATPPSTAGSAINTDDHLPLLSVADKRVDGAIRRGRGEKEVAR